MLLLSTGNRKGSIGDLFDVYWSSLMVRMTLLLRKQVPEAIVLVEVGAIFLEAILFEP